MREEAERAWRNWKLVKKKVRKLNRKEEDEYKKLAGEWGSRVWVESKQDEMRVWKASSRGRRTFGRDIWWRWPLRTEEADPLGTQTTFLVYCNNFPTLGIARVGERIEREKRNRSRAAKKEGKERKREWKKGKEKRIYQAQIAFSLLSSKSNIEIGYVKE